jgi:hypothetical protein
MPRSARILATAVFALATAGSLAFGASQALARPAVSGEARFCGDCDAYCKDLYGPLSTGRCMPGGYCLCMQAGT